MPSRAPSQDLVRFGTFELDLLTGELRKAGLRVRLQEQPFRVLAMLVERPGDLVTHEELKARIWPEAVFVDFEHGLHKAVNKLRRALGESAGTPRFVETLVRRGYRFIAPVEGRPSPAAALAHLHLRFESHTVLLAEGHNLLGRDERSVVVLDSTTVSRRHAMIVVEGGKAVLEDLGSKNGTRVGGHRVEGPVVLVDGDQIQVGALHLTFRAPAAHDATKTAEMRRMEGE
jgi:DNA-binding winged helix-turn-helix (wHTH) protein